MVRVIITSEIHHDSLPQSRVPCTILRCLKYSAAEYLRSGGTLHERHRTDSDMQLNPGVNQDKGLPGYAVASATYLAVLIDEFMLQVHVPIREQLPRSKY